MGNNVVQPVTLKELADSLMTDGKKIFFAGGTDIMNRLRLHPPGPVTVIDLSQMDDLKSFHHNEMGLRIGAMCTMTELSRSSLVKGLADVLAAAAAQVGSTQIRNRATVGGNVANAAQCADTIPPLIALDADVELMNGQGAIRTIKVEEFVTGIGRTLITEQEVVTGFNIPARSLNLRGGYGKIGSRKAVTIAKVNGAGVFRIDEDTVKYARVAFGSLGTRGFYSPCVSAGMEGMTVDQLRDGKYMDFFVEQVDRAIPGRDSLSYKRSAVRAVAASIVEQAISEYGRVLT